MKYLTRLISYLVLAYSCRADTQVIFKNNDSISGIILDKSTSSIKLQNQYFGTLVIPRKEIKTIKNDEPKPTKKKPKSKASTNNKRKIFSILPIKEAKQRPLTSFIGNNKGNGKWSGKAELSLALQERSRIDHTGKSDNTQNFEFYKLNGDMAWKKGRNNLTWQGAYRYRRSDIRKIDDFLKISQNYKNDLSESYFARAKTVFQRDYGREIDNEFLQSVELGINWFDSEKLKFSTAAGGAYHQYQRIPESDKRGSSGEGKFIFNESLRWNVMNSLAVIQKLTHLGDTEKYRIVFSSGIENKLIYDLFVRLEYKLDKDTDTTYDNKGYYDKRLVTSLLYKF